MRVNEIIARHRHSDYQDGNKWCLADHQLWPCETRRIVLYYAQALLVIATEAGEDTSDLTHPDQLVQPAIEELALEAVRVLAASYGECLAEGAA